MTAKMVNDRTLRNISLNCTERFRWFCKVNTQVLHWKQRLGDAVSKIFLFRLI
jgi:hypothetical protein